MKRSPIIDFARSPIEMRRFWLFSWALFSLILGIELGLIAWQSKAISSERIALQGEQSRLSQRLKQAPETKISKALSARYSEAQAMVSDLSVPWEGLLSALESAHGGAVVIESIHPEVSGKRIEIGGLAANFAEITAFISRLSSSSVLQNVVLITETSSLDTPGAIRFVLTAHWVKEQ